MRKFKVRVFHSRVDKMWYFSINASNGKIIAQSEGYHRRGGALKTALSIRDHIAKATIHADLP